MQQKMASVWRTAYGSEVVRGEEVVLKIADFGLSKEIGMSQSRASLTSLGVGTACWIPPEGLSGGGAGGGGASKKKNKLTFSYDVHPAGSLMYFILSGGQHAFPGTSQLAVNNNIANNKPKSSFPAGAVNGVSKMERLEAIHLITAMVQSDPQLRPGASRSSTDKCMHAVLRDHGALVGIAKRRQLRTQRSARATAARLGRACHTVTACQAATGGCFIQCLSCYCP